MSGCVHMRPEEVCASCRPRPKEWDEPQACRQCGKPAERARWCYATPVCYACLPPPSLKATAEPIISDQIAAARRPIEAELWEALEHLRHLSGELAENLALDMDHANKDHSKWYRKVKKARRFIASRKVAEQVEPEPGGQS